jgi:hypothetical protein
MIFLTHIYICICVKRIHAFQLNVESLFDSSKNGDGHVFMRCSYIGLMEITITDSGCRGKPATNPNANRRPVTNWYPNHPAVAIGMDSIIFF